MTCMASSPAKTCHMSSDRHIERPPFNLSPRLASKSRGSSTEHISACEGPYHGHVSHVQRNPSRGSQVSNLTPILAPVELSQRSALGRGTRHPCSCAAGRLLPSSRQGNSPLQEHFNRTLCLKGSSASSRHKAGVPRQTDVQSFFETSLGEGTLHSPPERSRSVTMLQNSRHHDHL
jgi:hypothetical protein